MGDLTKTRSALVNRALKSLGMIEPGETSATEDYATVNDMVDPLIARLQADRILYVSDVDAIKLEYFEPLARLLANDCGPDFGSPINEEAKKEDERTLRRLTTAAATFEPLKVEYF